VKPKAKDGQRRCGTSIATVPRALLFLYDAALPPSLSTQNVDNSENNDPHASTKTVQGQYVRAGCSAT